jgi:hypothetical protein
MSKNNNSKTRNDTSIKPDRRSKKISKVGNYNGILYESLEEWAFLCWIFELKTMGYIKNIARSDSYLLSDQLLNNFVVNLKTKSRPDTQALMNGHSYTPEFNIVWKDRALEKMVWILDSKVKREKSHLFIGKRCPDGSVESVIEIKPPFDFNSMTRMFVINQKWMWQRHNIYVNLIKPQELFKNTFTPVEYILTSTGKQRKINWKVKSMYEYLNNSK